VVTLSADELVAAARREREDLLIIARARDAAHAAHLYRIAASDAVPETIEASLQLSEAVLVDVGVPMGPVIASIHEKRAALQTGIKAMAPEAEVIAGRRRLAIDCNSPCATERHEIGEPPRKKNLRFCDAPRRPRGQDQPDDCPTMELRGGSIAENIRTY
jgi:monovalent cation:H+ antiporter-2, CPA2 family